MLKKDIIIGVIYNLLFSIFTVLLDYIIFYYHQFFSRVHSDVSVEKSAIALLIVIELLIILFLLFKKTLFKKKMHVLHIINFIFLLHALTGTVWNFSIILSLLKTLVTAPLIIYLNKNEFNSNKIFFEKLIHSLFIGYILFSFLISLYPHLLYLHFFSYYPLPENINFHLRKLGLSYYLLHFTAVIEVAFTLFLIFIFVYKVITTRSNKLLVIFESINIIFILGFGSLYAISAFTEVINTIHPIIKLIDTPFLDNGLDNECKYWVFNEHVYLIRAITLCIVVNIAYRVCSFVINKRKKSNYENLNAN